MEVAKLLYVATTRASNLVVAKGIGSGRKVITMAKDFRRRRSIRPGVYI
jgi:hypothetical protein